MLVEFHFRTTIRLGTTKPAPITVLKLGSILIKEREKRKLIEINGSDSELVTRTSSDPYSLFLFAMNLPETRVKYIARLRRFFDYIKSEKEVILTSGVPEVKKQKKRTGAMKEKWILFTERAKSDGGWAFFKL